MIEDLLSGFKGIDKALERNRTALNKEFGGTIGFLQRWYRRCYTCFTGLGRF